MEEQQRTLGSGPPLLLASLTNSLAFNVATNAAHLGSQLLIVVVAPMTRVEDGPVERHDSWGFLVGASLREVGIAFDLWAAGGGGEGPKLFGRLPGPFGADVPIEQVNILFDLGAEAAAIYNGRKPSGRNILAIGAGALGETSTPDGIDLVHEDDARLMFLCITEHLADQTGGFADVFIDNCRRDHYSELLVMLDTNWSSESYP